MSYCQKCSFPTIRCEECQQQLDGRPPAAPYPVSLGWQCPNCHKCHNPALPTCNCHGKEVPE